MPEQLILKGTGELLDKIPLESIHSNPTTSFTHENLTTLTSYNLLEKRRRTIIVPGTPSLWSPLPLPVQIASDAYRSICDAAGHVFPKCPLEPLLRALFTTRPDYNLTSTDLITDRRNLHLLYDFATGKKTEFRINVEVAGNTVLFSRWMEHTAMYTKATAAGYGHGFERAFTKVPELAQDSISHNRVVAYQLGGINIIMRFKVDGYVSDGGRTPSPEHTYTGPTSAELQANNVQPPTGLTVRIGGEYIDPAKIIEIKTSRSRKPVNPQTKVQMWLSQTQTVLIGGHKESGVYDEVKEVDMIGGGRMANWLEWNREKIRRLVRVVEMVIEVAKKKGGKCIIVHEEGEKVLKIYSVADERGCGLPADLLAKWQK